MTATKRHQTDVLVIGAGPGGYTAAFRAADLGLKVTVVERESRPGGTCLLAGCIPSKALLHAAEILDSAKHAKAFGLSFSEPKMDIDQMRSWKDGIIDRLSGGLTDLHKRRNIEFMQGKVAFESDHSVRLEGGAVETIDFNYAVIAAGSEPIPLPGADENLQGLLDSTSALELQDIPGRLLVIGGGVIALELGSVYAQLGSEVTFVELTDGLLPGVDRDLVRVVQKRVASFVKDIHVGTKVTGITQGSKGLDVSLEGAVTETQTFDKVLCAIGRRPNSPHLDLDKAGVMTDERGFITVDAYQRTNQPHIYAIGDITGQPMLAHKAAYEGKVAAEVLSGDSSAAYDPQAIPAVVYTDPEVAWCGLTETEAKAKGITIEVGKFPWAASGRNMTLGRSEGLTKLIFEPETERILGVGIAGSHAGELIAEGMLAIEMAATAHDIGGTIHSHPSLSETFSGAAEAFLGSATEIYAPKRQ